MLSNELIDKFLNNRASAAEADEVVAYFQQHPEEMEKYFSAEEWTRITEKHLPAEIESQLDKEVLGKTNPKRVNKISFLAAACTIGIVAVSFFWFLNSGNKIQESIAKHTKELSIYNETEDIKVVKLADGSSIYIYPKSTLSYPEQFEDDSRKLKIKGKARFNVAKDKDRPFTVFSGNVATTALGTVFLVDDTKETITVSLLEGKVVLKPINHNGFKDVYLNVNEECVIEKKDNRITVQKIQQEKQITKEEIIIVQQPQQESSPQKTAVLKDESIVLNFHQTPMNKVLKAISIKFGQPIQFDNEEMKAIYFTGGFKEGEEIEKILNTVCKTNGLKAAYTKEYIQIKKQ